MKDDGGWVDGCGVCVWVCVCVCEGVGVCGGGVCVRHVCHICGVVVMLGNPPTKQHQQHLKNMLI